MVGTFYRAASPADPPFVQVGTVVRPGDTLCIIEAMKLMNLVTAETAGTVLQIIPANEQPIQFGQPLFVIA